MPQLSLLAVPLLISLLATHELAAEAVKTDTNDLAYLRQLAAATGADQALGWHVGSDPCEDSWSGVDCDYTGKVTVISLQDKGLHGSVPDAADGSLSMIENLYLGGNMFTGTLPMLPLPHLRFLGLDRNYFTTMPDKFFTGMPELVRFNITNNTALAAWSLADELRSLKQLRSFHASHAGINGSLHQFFSNGTTGFPFPFLDKVSLSFNQLSGHVPEIKGSKISKLDLSNNLLSGPISFICDLASSVDQLRLSHNRFTGPLPDFTGFKGLNSLYVDHNEITGVVPASLVQLSGMMVIYLSGNLLQGPVPEFGNDVQTDVTKAAARGSFCRLDNGPCAPDVDSLLLIARGFGYPQIFASSWIRDDPCAGWPGVHCDDHHRVRGINLSRLGLNGTMDSAFGSLKALEAILLSGNNIAGEIPASVAQLPSLHVLDVSNNDLVGTIPKFRHDVAVWIEGNPRLELSGSSLSEPTTVYVFAILVVVTLLQLFHA